MFEELIRQQSLDEISILVTIRHELAGSEIVYFQAQSCMASSTYRILHANDPLLPATRQRGALERKPVDVEAEGTMKIREFSESTVHQIRVRRAVLGLDIDLD